MVNSNIDSFPNNKQNQGSSNSLGRVLAPDSSPIKADQQQSPNSNLPSNNSTPTRINNHHSHQHQDQKRTMNNSNRYVNPIDFDFGTRPTINNAFSKSRPSNIIPSSSSPPTNSTSFNGNNKRLNPNSNSSSSSSSSKPIKNPRLDLSKYSSNSQQLPKKSSSSSSNNTKGKAKGAPSSSSGTDDDEDSEEESDREEEEPPKKKKRFQRGGRKTPPLESPIRSDSIGTNSFKSTINGGSHSNSSTSISSPSSQSNGGSSNIDPNVMVKARRIADLMRKKGHPISPEQTADILLEFKDTGKAMEVCKERFPIRSMSASNSPSQNGAGGGGSNSRNSTPVPAINRKRTKHDDDDERDGNDDDESDDGREAQDEEEKRGRAAIKWFNECDEGALIDTTGCSANQAATIMRLRPFEDVDDAENRLDDKANKGVTSKLFFNCLELMAGYYEVDNVLEKCEKTGADLHLAMASWNINPAIAPSRGGTPGTPTAETSNEGSSTTIPKSEEVVQASTPEAGVLSLSNVSRPDLIKDPDYLHGQPENLGKGIVLKDYQLVGVNWLSLLYRKRTSAILADEMGLGKTAQVIAFLTTLENKGIKGPHLVVVPSSVLENWNREFKLFAPKIYVRSYYGNQNERRELRDELKNDKDLNVVLTTYDIAAGSDLDHKFLRKQNFNVCVFDEGHMLKNRKSQKYDKLLKISAQWRLLLTGTPLQNNLQELISLLNFIMPEYFRDAEESLTAIFKVKPGAQKNELSKQRVERARKMMQPFVLRRKKDKVLTELCSKFERVELCEMTPPQKKLYQDALRRTQKVIVQEVEGEETSKTVRAGSRLRGGKAGAKENGSGNILMDLRKAANHPLLFRDYYDDAKIAALAKDYVKEPEHADENLQHLKEDFTINSDAQLSLLANSWPFTQKHKLPDSHWMNSGKIQALKRLIPEIQAKGDRILIFSQFTTVLDILCVALDIMGVKYVGFTGQTNVGDRQHLVDQFTNDDSITVFLLSTKAGGLGINLVAANWVIMYDQDFNPQNDKQAADRCYRMGQTKEVTVIKLISTETIDESMHDLGKRKLELANRVSGEGLEVEEGEEVGNSLEKSLLSELKKQMVDKDAAEAATASSGKIEEMKMDETK